MQCDEGTQQLYVQMSLSIMSPSQHVHCACSKFVGCSYCMSCRWLQAIGERMAAEVAKADGQVLVELDWTDSLVHPDNRCWPGTPVSNDES